jgi:hypothetical protein
VDGVIEVGELSQGERSKDLLKVLKTAMLKYLMKSAEIDELKL